MGKRIKGFSCGGAVILGEKNELMSYDKKCKENSP